MNKRIIEIARAITQEGNKLKFSTERGVLYELSYHKHPYDGEETICLTPRKLDSVIAPLGNLENEDIDLFADWLTDYGFGTKLKGESNERPSRLQNFPIDIDA